MSAEMSAEWFDEGPAGTAVTEAFAVVSENEHQAALAEVDLPPRPLRLRPSRWLPVLRWSSETLQVAVGATLGCGTVLAVLSLIAWLSR